jgi:preprotein translocase subunit SecY
MARNTSEMAGMLGGIGRLKELRQRLFVVLVALVIFRAGTFIPVPGVNPNALVQLMDQAGGTIVGVFNMFSGGALGRFSIFALGVMPYISAAIIIQLMSHAIPQLQQLRKEGESGRRKITQYTRYFTVVLAAFQGFGVAVALQSQSAGSQLPVVISPGPGFVIAAVITLTAGTVFLMWLGEQITERGIGNGISILIFAGIVAGLPGAIAATLDLVRTGQLGILTATFFLVLAITVTAFVVFVERGQRRITVNYAQRQGRQAYRSQSTHLPLKVNMAGVIPAIFASSLVLFPGTITTWFGQAGDSGWLQAISQQLSPGQPLYILIFGGMVMFFCFFYTAIVFNSKETADNLKKSGAFIPGIRPGRQTGEYIDYVLTRLTLIGAFYLAAVCLLPEFILLQWQNVPFYFGGTSLLIIVVVTMDFMAQLQAHLMSHQYDSLLKKSNLKGYGRSGVVRR